MVSQKTDSRWTDWPFIDIKTVSPLEGRGKDHTGPRKLMGQVLEAKEEKLVQCLWAFSEKAGVRGVDKRKVTKWGLWLWVSRLTRENQQCFQVAVRVADNELIGMLFLGSAHLLGAGTERAGD